MDRVQVTPSVLNGAITIPPSKSHTIRAVAIAGMADGTSVIGNPLISEDALSCVQGIRSLGASVDMTDLNSKRWIVRGVPKKIYSPSETIDIGNSGTSLRILTAMAALSPHTISFDGDHSIRKRPMIPLLKALSNLGVNVQSTDGKCPLSIQGPIKGGKTTVDGISSQFISALLLACPLAEGDSEIIIENLHEQPYIEMTLNWLSKQNIEFQMESFNRFFIKGGQMYHPFEETIPSDFSSATFPLCAAVITKSDILIQGLDFSDSQGDKAVFNHLIEMGADIIHENDGVRVRGSELHGGELDLNFTPDALPALAVVGCFARGQTRLVNVSQARLKECDRISAISTELSKMGADISETPDGMIINHSILKGTGVKGYHDHRMVMALAIAGMASEGITEVDTADALAVTYPSFINDMQKLGAHIFPIPEEGHS